MNDKMLSNDHKMMQIKHQVKDEQKTLMVEQEILNVKQHKLAEAQHGLTAVQQERLKIRESIREESELARIDKNTPKDFFKIQEKAKGNKNAVYILEDDLIKILKKKLSNKEELLRMIEPLAKHMKGKFYIRSSKRKQRDQLKFLHKQLTNDVLNLTKALQMFR